MQEVITKQDEEFISIFEDLKSRMPIDDLIHRCDEKQLIGLRLINCESRLFEKWMFIFEKGCIEESIPK